MNNKLRFITNIIVILINLAYFCLGVSEAIFVSRYSEFDDQCREIWVWILTACVLDIVIPVIGFCGIRALFKGDDEPDSAWDEFLYYAKVGQFVVAIWCGITYYNIDSACYYFWTSQAPQLWTFVMIHFVAMWIGVACFAIFVLVVTFVCCAVAFAPRGDVTSLRQNSKLFNIIAKYR